jgi:hypothetical protein
MPDIGSISQNNALKAVQSGLTQQDTAQKTQGIMLFGQDGTPNGKCPLSTKAVIDLKTGKSLEDILEYNKPYVDTDLYVDMGLPSGVLWAKKNIDITQQNGFTASEFQYECSFCSWGNTDMYNPNAQNSFAGVYDWGGVNENEPYYEGQPYGSTPGAALTANFGPSFDAARRHLGAPWRMPSTEEFKELFDNCDFIDADGNLVTESTSVAGTAADKRITMNGIVGLRLRSKINGNVIFFPASGGGNGTSWNSRGAYGYYWSSSWNSARNARNLVFYSGGVGPQVTNNRCLGFAVRPVQ